MARVGIIHGSGHFEAGDLTGFWWEDHSNKPEVVSEGYPVRTGIYSMRCLVDADDLPPPLLPKTEARVGPDDTAPEGTKVSWNYTIGDEYWIGFSVFVPADWIPQATDALDDHVLNIQARPDTGEAWRSPVLGITLRKADWMIRSHWDYGEYTPNWDGTSQTTVNFNDVIGYWTDFVVNVEWNATDDTNGKLKVWINGVLEVDRTGPNCSNDARGPQHTFGAYCWYFDNPEHQANINQRIRIYYFDEHRIGDDTSSYDDVAPGAAPEPPPPPPPDVSAGRSIASSSYKIRLKSAAGVLVAEVTDFDALCYSKRINSPGLSTFRLDGSHAAIALLEHKSQVEVWRANPRQGLDWHCDFYGLYLKPDHFQPERHIFTATCPGQMWFLGTRIVAWYTGYANRAKFTGVIAETIMKTLVGYNACANATTGNGRERDGAITGLSIQADGAAGNSLNWNCAWKNLLTELQDLALVAGGDFDLIKTAAQAWQFRWYTGQRGTDRRSTVIFARERGNMAIPHYLHNRIDEKTVAIVGGQNEGGARDIVIRTGDDYSAANDVETFVDARRCSATAGYNAAGDKRLGELRAREKFTWEVVQTPACFYGQVASGGDYELGDLVTARAFDIEKEHKIVGVTVTVVPTADSCETIDIEVETPVTASYRVGLSTSAQEEMATKIQELERRFEALEAQEW